MQIQKATHKLFLMTGQFFACSVWKCSCLLPLMTRYLTAWSHDSLSLYSIPFLRFTWVGVSLALTGESENWDSWLYPQTFIDGINLAKELCLTFSSGSWFKSLISQSETCSVEIPELEFELGMAVLGGKFTTLEGLLKDIRELVSHLSIVHGCFSAAVGEKAGRHRCRSFWSW